MSENKVKRSEFCFLYESVFANANGDPVNENRPRIDEETGLQFVTMYRIKRTVRDYLKVMQLIEHKEGNDVLVKAETYTEGKQLYLKPLEMLLKDKVKELNAENITNAFIDTRLFGGVIAVKGNTIHLQGPIQVSYGKSLHEVKEEEIHISAVMPSGPKKQNGTLGVSHIVPYSLIGADGSVNQYNAEKTGLSQNDVDLFFKALWEGTNELKTTSKNQKSLLLCNVVFNNKHQLATIGNLKDYLQLDTSLDDTAIRSTKDYTIDITKLVEKLSLMEDKLEKVEFFFDTNLTFTYQGETVSNLEEFIPKLVKKVL